MRAPANAIALPARVHELIHAAFEGVVDGERSMVRKWQELHHDHSRNGAGRIEPIVGVTYSEMARQPRDGIDDRPQGATHRAKRVSDVGSAHRRHRDPHSHC